MWVKRPHVGPSPKMIFTILTFKKGKYVANIVKTLVKCPYLKQEKNVKYITHSRFNPICHSIYHIRYFTIFLSLHLKIIKHLTRGHLNIHKTFKCSLEDIQTPLIAFKFFSSRCSNVVASNYIFSACFQILKDFLFLII